MSAFEIPSAQIAMFFARRKPMPLTPYVEGYRDGLLDASEGVEPNRVALAEPTSEYAKNYSAGYHQARKDWSIQHGE